MKISLPASSLVHDFTLECAEPGLWSFDADLSTAPDGAEILRLRLAAPEDAVPPAFRIGFTARQTGVRSIWRSGDDVPTLPPSWGGHYKSDIAHQTPVIALLDAESRAPLAIAVDEALREVKWQAGLLEESGFVQVGIRFFTLPEAPIRTYEVSLRLAAGDFWADAVRAASDWVCSRQGRPPMEAPEAAFEPLYSSWYCFHQDVFDKELEEEFALAADLGMETLIVDDGWQTDDTHRGYAFCGDWEPSARRFPDFPAHVARTHAMGLKYMLWFSVPFIGIRSRNYERFRGKYLYVREGLGAAVLDPRFPEVREYLASTLERIVRELDLDGLKLDFIDSIFAQDPDPAAAENWAGRDIRSVPDSVDALMTEIRRRLVALKPDILIEFRQSYMGPAIRTFGNMIRAGDVPADPLRNRARTARLRLTSGTTAVHSDMLEWNPLESPEQAAAQILSVLFSVIQYSMRLKRLPEAHLRMLRHWISWTREHRNALLHGDFRPHHPELGYPLLEGRTDAERIAAVYLRDFAVGGSAADRELWVVNGSESAGLLLELADAPVSAEAFDVYGDTVPITCPAAGLSRVPVPVAGLLRLRW